MDNWREQTTQVNHVACIHTIHCELPSFLVSRFYKDSSDFMLHVSPPYIQLTLTNYKLPLVIDCTRKKYGRLLFWEVKKKSVGLFFFSSRCSLCRKGSKLLLQGVGKQLKVKQCRFLFSVQWTDFPTCRRTKSQKNWFSIASDKLLRLGRVFALLCFLFFSLSLMI